MRCAVLADIHSNLAAFHAILADIERGGGGEEVWCPGDIVGYGPDPHECVELLQRREHICVAGNHDLAATGKIDTFDFNPDAAAAAHWTSRNLTREDIEFLNSLPLVARKGDFTIVHGSPREPIWEYILSVESARENFDYFDTRYCFIGHSHVPLVFRLDASGACHWSRLLPETALALGEERLIINPGGVGQPRDGDPRASYALYDSGAGTVELHRVPYAISSTQQKMAERRLPPRLASRLSYGM